jgi:hypothetical protein
LLAFLLIPCRLLMLPSRLFTMPYAAVADDWEDWEDETFEPKLEASANGQAKGQLTKGQAALAPVKEPDESKFAGEDEESTAPPTWEKSVPKPQQV